MFLFIFFTIGTVYTSTSNWNYITSYFAVKLYIIIPVVHRIMHLKRISLSVFLFYKTLLQYCNDCYPFLLLCGFNFLWRCSFCKPLETTTVNCHVLKDFYRLSFSYIAMRLIWKRIFSHFLSKIHKYLTLDTGSLFLIKEITLVGIVQWKLKVMSSSKFIRRNLQFGRVFNFESSRCCKYFYIRNFSLCYLSLAQIDHKEFAF